MWGLAEIVHANDEAARLAAARGGYPYVPFDEHDILRMPGGSEWDGDRGFPFPVLGFVVPEDWEFVDRVWVSRHEEASDYSALSSLSWEEFNRFMLDRVRESRSLSAPRRVGYGIEKLSDHQLCIGVYQKREEQVHETFDRLPGDGADGAGPGLLWVFLRTTVRLGLYGACFLGTLCRGQFVPRTSMDAPRAGLSP